jgi:hypothetical protein
MAVGKLVYTRFKRPEKKLTQNSGELKVEKAGYIPIKKQIQSLIDAGRRLDDARRESYDFGDDDEIDYEYSDPTRDSNFDLSDAHNLATQTEMNLQAAEDQLAEEIASQEAEAAARAELAEAALQEQEAANSTPDEV